jgi:hypothetical protein
MLAVLVAVTIAPPAAAQEPDWVRTLERQIERHAEAFARMIEDQFGERAPQRPRPQPPRRDAGPQVTEPFSRTVQLGRNGTVDLQNIAGDIVVTGRGGDEVRIDAVKRTRRTSTAADRALLQAIRIDVVERGGNVEIRTEHPRRRNTTAAVDYTLSVPSAANVTLRTISGDVRITNVRGEVRAESNTGSIRATAVERLRQIRSMSGTLEVTDAEGDEVGGGTLSGDVVVRNLKARTITLSTVSGDMRFTGVESDRASLSSFIGDIDFAGRLARSGRYEFSTHSGGLRVSPASSQGFDIDASSLSGNVQSDYQIKLQPAASLGFRPGTARGLRGTVGDAGAALVLRSFSGNIEILRP